MDYFGTSIIARRQFIEDCDGVVFFHARSMIQFTITPKSLEERDETEKH